MPNTWDAAAEAKLMAALFAVCDVKVAGPQLKQLAEIMGNDCTPKAIIHRLAKLRKAGGGAETTGKSDTGEPKLKKIKTGAAVKKPAARQPAKKRAKTPVEDSDDEEAATQLTPPTTVDRPQRRGIKRSYDETSIKEEEVDDEDEDNVVVMGEDGLPKGYDGIDVGEDIGQGLRAGKVDLTGESDGEESELSEHVEDVDQFEFEIEVEDGVDVEIEVEAEDGDEVEIEVEDEDEEL